MRALVTTLITLAALLLIPRHAAATKYVWVQNLDTAWDNAANWTCEPGTGDCAAGFPDKAGDEAAFTGAAYGNPVRVTIPNGDITVGIIAFRPGLAVMFEAGGPDSLSILDNGAGQSAMMSSAAGGGSQEAFRVPIELHSTLVVSAPSLHAFIFERPISGAHGIVMRGTPAVQFDLDQGESHTYTGETVVEGGVLALGLPPHAPGRTMPGALVIGDGDLATAARITVNVADQIADAAPITVNVDGELVLNEDERVGAVTNNAGTIRMSSTVGVGQVTLNGGAVDMRLGGTLQLHGDVTVSHCEFRGAANGTSRLNLLDATSTSRSCAPAADRSSRPTRCPRPAASPSTRPASTN